MLYKELLSAAKKHDINACILSYADSTHYMIGHITNDRHYDIATDRQGNPMCFHCLTEAKDALKKAGCTCAWFVMQSPYDEMSESLLGDDSSSSMKINLP